MRVRMIDYLRKLMLFILFSIGIPQNLDAQTDYTSNVVVSDYAFVDGKDNPISGSWSGTSDSSIPGYYRINYDLSSVGGNVKAGDFFTYKIPADFQVQGVEHNLTVNGEVVAKMTVDTATGTIKVTFNENATKMANFHGKLYIPVRYKPQDGSNQITYPDGTQGPAILWTTKAPSSVKNEKLSKRGSVLSSDKSKILWSVVINRHTQDFGSKEVIVKDKLYIENGRGDEVVTYIPDSFVMWESDFDLNNPNDNIGNTKSRVWITQDEDKYKSRLAAGEKVAFLKILPGGVDSSGQVQQSFELHLGNAVGTKSYLLQYYTPNPDTGAKIINGASIFLEGKETLPWDEKDGKVPTSPEVVVVVTTPVDKNSTIAADFKDKLRLTKYDGETGAYLAGAVFTLKKADGTYVTTLTTDAQGVASSDILNAGDYILTEITAPSGYELLKDPISITVVYNKATLVSVPNQKIPPTPTRSFTAHKIWKGVDENLPNPTISVVLQKDGEDYLSAGRKQIVNGQTSVTWERLPITNTDGSVIKYTVREMALDEFDTTYEHTTDATTITNTLKKKYCHRPANTSGIGLDTNHGITLLKRAGARDKDNWPMVRKGAWTALESNTKGLVVTRMTTAQIGAIASPQEGMITYDTDAKCLKIYNGTQWSCFSTPSCPEN